MIAKHLSHAFKAPRQFEFRAQAHIQLVAVFLPVTQHAHVHMHNHIIVFHGKRDWDIEISVTQLVRPGLDIRVHDPANGKAYSPTVGFQGFEQGFELRDPVFGVVVVIAVMVGAAAQRDFKILP